MSRLKNFCAVMIGAPGSGKGTISGRLVKQFQFSYIASGDILRNNIKDQTELGRNAQKYINGGQLVPDNLMIDCILESLKKCGDRWLLDGFPRTVNQAEKLWTVHKLDAVVHLDVPFDVIIDRIKGRWVHIPSGRVYNIGFNEPKVPFKDDVTGEDLVQRDDDKPEAVRARLEVYANCTKPVLEFYKSKRILSEFKGRTSDEIWPNVKRFFDGKIV